MLYPRLLLLFAAVGYCYSLSQLFNSIKPAHELPLKPDERRPLHGRFLHITDIHPDPYYKLHTRVDENCHRGAKDDHETGIFGHPISECDSPMSLVNATFDWIRDNLKDKIDFVIWTGDNARHDNDNHLPRSASAIYKLNADMVEKFKEVFGSKDPRNVFSIPIVPSLGNNDIYPHNVFPQGPNLQTKTLYNLWRSMVPEEQVHVFDRGVSFMVEVIPEKLAVLSINTIYWFKSNTLVDGCDGKKEPGHLLFRWLSIVFAELRARNMKVWLSGHVPPNSKLYEPSCLDRLSSWLHEYRDIVVGGVYGHMNLDHFLFLDSEAVTPDSSYFTKSGQDVSIKDKRDYMSDLRELYDSIHHSDPTRYAMSFVSPSVIPTYLPSLRVWEYNITGVLDQAPSIYSNGKPFRTWSEVFAEINTELDRLQEADDYPEDDDLETEEADQEASIDGKKKKHKKHKKKPDPTWPPDFGEMAAGPAYTAQMFSPTRYLQYYVKLREANANKNLTYELEYATDQAPYKMENLLVSSWIKLAKKLSDELSIKSEQEQELDQVFEHEYEQDQTTLSDVGKRKKEKLARKKKSRAAWKKYLHHAFVSSGYENED